MCVMGRTFLPRLPLRSLEGSQNVDGKDGSNALTSVFLLCCSCEKRAGSVAISSVVLVLTLCCRIDVHEDPQ